MLVGVPCMFYPCTENSNRIMIYFHANAEDVGLAAEFIRPIKETLNVKHTTKHFFKKSIKIRVDEETRTLRCLITSLYSSKILFLMFLGPHLSSGIPRLWSLRWPT